MSDPILQIDDLSLEYSISKGPFQRRAPLTAIDGISLALKRGESLALVGESGCGKSSLARVLVGLEEPSSGKITYDGAVMGARRGKGEQRRMQMVFQDPVLSLNPLRTVRQVLDELLRVHKVVPESSIHARCLELMDLVGLPARYLDSYPRQLSGGQRQRVGIARALALEPKVLIADEPVSALDVSVQATILELLSSLQANLGLALLFITHDLGVVRYLCDRVAVMYLGRIVETGRTEEVFANPRHPYTQALLKAAPSLVAPRRPGEAALEGELPSPLNIPPGCRFAPRCPAVVDRCRHDDPILTVFNGTGSHGHSVWCHIQPPLKFSMSAE